MNEVQSETAQTGANWMRDTSLFRLGRQLRDEIAVHKWYESERAGRDIGWERAQVSYFLRVPR